MGNGGELMKRILVPTDFSAHSLEALKQAVKYTNTVRGELLLLHVVEEEPLRWYAMDGLPEAPSSRVDPTGRLILPQKPQKLVHRDLCAEAEWKLTALLPPQRDRFRTQVTVGNAADEIVRVAREQKADLIIMGTRGRKGLRRWLRGSAADRVRRKAPVVVMTVEPHRLCLERFPSHDQGGAQRVEDGTATGAREAWERVVAPTAPVGMAAAMTARARPEATHEGAATPRRPQRAGRWRRGAVGERGETAPDRAALR
jgi:universal stress protein A